MKLIRTWEKLQRDWGQLAVCKQLKQELKLGVIQQIRGLRLSEKQGECLQTGKEKGN